MTKCIQSLLILNQFPSFWYVTNSNTPHSFDAIQQIIYAIFLSIGLSNRSIIRGITQERIRGVTFHRFLLFMMTFKPALFLFLGLAIFGSHSSFANTQIAPPRAGSPALLFYGNSMIERLLEHGGMEARLQIATSGKDLKIRSLAWTGDEVGNRLRL